MKITKTLTWTAAALTLSAPAFADGTHSHNTLANIIHWLSSPAHSLFAVIGGVAFVATLVAMKRRKA
ncbi:MAG: hypothetical protein ABJ275_09300 [Maricaulaceae bacterium]